MIGGGEGGGGGNGEGGGGEGDGGGGDGDGDGGGGVVGGTSAFASARYDSSWGPGSCSLPTRV